MNKVFLIGNLTRDPEISTTNSGVQLCRFSIAVNRTYANADGVREADFFNITAWRNLAERCGKYLHKGNKVSVMGSIQIRNYESNGERRTSVDVVADDVEFLTPRTGESSSSYESDTSTNSAPSTSTTTKVTELEPVEDSDLPF